MTDKVTFENKRTFFRLDTTLTCTIHLTRLGERNLNHDKPFAGIIKNVSASGLCFGAWDRDLPVNDLMIWKFSFSLGGREFEVYGRILRKKLLEDSFYEYGVKLDFLDDKKQNVLLQTLNLLQAQKRLKQRLQL